MAIDVYHFYSSLYPSGDFSHNLLNQIMVTIKNQIRLEDLNYYHVASNREFSIGQCGDTMYPFCVVHFWSDSSR